LEGLIEDQDVEATEPIPQVGVGELVDCGDDQPIALGLSHCSARLGNPGQGGQGRGKVAILGVNECHGQTRVEAANPFDQAVSLLVGRCGKRYPQGSLSEQAGGFRHQLALAGTGWSCSDYGCPLTDTGK
jgi:hypothetical protein